MAAINHPAGDVHVVLLGAVVLVTPMTDAARAWIDEHIADGAMWCGPSIAVEYRFAGELLSGMAAARLRLG
jgi:hypothetical protein